MEEMKLFYEKIDINGEKQVVAKLIGVPSNEFAGLLGIGTSTGHARANLKRLVGGKHSSHNQFYNSAMRAIFSDDEMEDAGIW